MTSERDKESNIKKDKDTKKVFKAVSITDYKVLEPHYKKMAAKGWLLVKNKGPRDTYKRIDPCDLDFSVNVFQPTWGIDYPDTKKEQVYEEFCQDSGWKLAAKNERYHVYYKNADDEAIPIHTDPKEEYQTIKSAFFKSEIIFVFLILLQIFQFTIGIMNFRYDDILASSGLFTIISPLLIIVIFMMFLFPTLRWMFINSKRVKKGLALQFDSEKKVKVKYQIYYSLTILYLLYVVNSIINMTLGGMPLVILAAVFIPIIIIFIVISFYKRNVKRVKRSRKVNIIILIVLVFVLWIGSIVITFGIIGSSIGDNNELENEKEKVLSHQVPVLMLNDFGIEVPFEAKWYREESNFLVPLSFEYNERLQTKEETLSDIEFQYIQTRYDWVRNWIIKRAIKDKEKSYAWREELNFENGVETLYKIGDVIKDTSSTDNLEQIISLSTTGYKVMLVKDNRIYILEMNVPIEGDVLDTVVKTLF